MLARKGGKMEPILQAAIDALVFVGGTSAANLVGLKIGYQVRREEEKVEKHNKEVEAKNDRRSLKD